MNRSPQWREGGKGQQEIVARDFVFTSYAP